VRDGVDDDVGVRRQSLLNDSTRGRCIGRSYAAASSSVSTLTHPERKSDEALRVFAGAFVIVYGLAPRSRGEFRHAEEVMVQGGLAFALQGYDVRNAMCRRHAAVESPVNIS